MEHEGRQKIADCDVSAYTGDKITLMFVMNNLALQILQYIANLSATARDNAIIFVFSPEFLQGQGLMSASDACELMNDEGTTGLQCCCLKLQFAMNGLSKLCWLQINICKILSVLRVSIQNLEWVVTILLKDFYFIRQETVNTQNENWVWKYIFWVTAFTMQWLLYNKHVKLKMKMWKNIFYTYLQFRTYLTDSHKNGCKNA